MSDDNKATSVKKMIVLFDNIIDLFDKFVEKVDEDIMQPLASNEDELVEQNLKKFGKSSSLIQVVRLISKTFEGLVSARINLDKNYKEEIRPSFDMEEATRNLDDKLRSLFKHKALPARIMEG